MGLFFTLLYIFVTYLTPVAIFGDYVGATFHIQEIIAVPTILFSLFALPGSGLTRMGQTYAAIGLTIAVIISILLTGWLGGAVGSLLGFLPNVLAFFFVAINCRKKSHLQALVVVLFCAAVFVIVMSQFDERSSGALQSDYFISMGNDAGAVFYRIRGLGVIHDPNDFGQYMMALIPCLFLFWGKGKALGNLLLVYMPTAILIGGLYLTHSRGALLALAAVCAVGMRRKVGILPSAIVGGGLVLGLMAFGFTGDRDISAANGEDRMGAWSAGLEMVRAQPIFGVGVNNFREYYEITAHNSIVVCAAETGIVGLFFWTLFVFSSLRDSWVIGEYGRKQEKIDAEVEAGRVGRLPPQRTPSLAGLQFAQPQLAGTAIDASLFHRSAMAEPATLRQKAPPMQVAEAPSFAAPQVPLPPAEIRRMATLMVLSLVGMLTAGWFLSRAFSMLVFIFGGMAQVIFRLARENGMDVPALKPFRALKLTTVVTFILLGAVYVILRVSHLFGH